MPIAYDVTSYFLTQIAKPTPNILRRFTVSGSDFSERVTRWPKFSKRWNDIRPVSVSIDLANEDQALNYLRDDPTQLRGEAKIEVGFRNPGQNHLLHSKDFGQSVWVSTGVSSIAYNALTSPMFRTDATQVQFGNGPYANNWIMQPLGVANKVSAISDYEFSVYLRIVDATYPVGSLSSTIVIEAKYGGFGGDTQYIHTASFDISSNWNRFSLPLDPISNASSFYVAIGANSYAGTFGIWGAQLTQSEISTPGQYEFIVTSDTHYPAGADEYISLYAGTIERVKYARGTATLSLKDKIKPFTEKVVGTSDVPVEYLNSNYLPSDVAWWLATSYGGLSGVQSISNTDIDYESFQTWAAVFSGDSVFVQARYEGKKVNEALRVLGRYTGSTIAVEDNLLTFNRYTAINSLKTNLEDNIKDVALYVDDSIIVNRQITFADYDVASDVWNISALAENSVSVESYGLREQVEREKSIWYVDSGSALNHAQRVLSTNGIPFDEYELTLPYNALNRQLGESVLFTNSFFGESSMNVYRIMQIQNDVDKGEMKLRVNKSQSLTPFVLDDATNGLLDQSYNFLL